ncbi:hypothetical protein RO3G_01145 [Rhizopus delemar RA 99-880]|uniref:Uncharacterized protein n=1 Tax=Rhizopus delemar (strain RA 99-880 / ATCC MYA-4621 / FGSC 9543 / NRRL 43880) TaxID=246409 RepID=I1BJR1_RHIO9|nr:hypothetical protein RO3G_01145 [Rhizopus delemar RA 99-880]|eukprot:EIE76441.1 hypothetical protein RO3G_01145 [Rhizopus delemar RA 99-880]
MDSQVLAQVVNRLIKCIFEEIKCCWSFAKGCIGCLIILVAFISFDEICRCIGHAFLADLDGIQCIKQVAIFTCDTRFLR